MTSKANEVRSMGKWAPWILVLVGLLGFTVFGLLRLTARVPVGVAGAGSVSSGVGDSPSALRAISPTEQPAGNGEAGLAVTPPAVFAGIRRSTLPCRLRGRVCY
jgi:hypothetical protein